MRALAKFIMRGRAQAALVAACGNLLPFISPATVGLVGLRKGMSEGLVVILWALLPSLLAFYFSDLNPIIIAASVVGLLVVLLAAEVLKVSVSWRYVLILITAASGVFAALMGLLFADELQSLQSALAEIFAEMRQEQEHPLKKFVPSQTFVMGLIGYVIALNAVLSLLVARWWQAALYNPGGFQTEFHQLRLGSKEALFLLAGLIFCQFGSTQSLSWAELFGLPLLLSGIALVHFIVTNRKLGSHWLVIFYIGLLTIGPLSLVLAVIGFLDSIMNFRSRLDVNTD